MESLYVFIAATKAHLQVQKLSDTRWSCSYRAVNALYQTYDSLLAVLHGISENNDHLKAVEVRDFLHHIAKFCFIVSLITFDRILSCRNSVSDQLQSVQIDLSPAANLIQATKVTLKNIKLMSFGIKYIVTPKMLQSHIVLR